MYDEFGRPVECDEAADFELDFDPEPGHYEDLL
jgi:hypothetical protein